MIVRTLAEIVGTDRDVDWGNGRSRRFLIAKDGMGFAFCDTFVKGGSESLLQYKNHLEACYCFEGRGEIEAISGEKWTLEPGTIYALNAHDKHYLRAFTDLRLVSIFNPPIQGHEKHSLSPGDESSY